MSAGTYAGTFPHHLHNFLLHSQLEVEPVVGFEPTTDGLQNRCSTTELNWLPKRLLFTKRGTVLQVHTAHGARIASLMPWMIFLSAGLIVASTPPSCGRAASPSPETK